MNDRESKVGTSEQEGRGGSAFFASTPLGPKQSEAIMARIFSAARHEAVFGEPIKAGDYTVITASEVGSGGGFGFGSGTSPAAPQQTTNGHSSGQSEASGAGGGGGGGASGRPVAFIVIGPDGVRVEPIVDVSRIALAGIKMWAAIIGIFASMAKGRKR